MSDDGFGGLYFESEVNGGISIFNIQTDWYLVEVCDGKMLIILLADVSSMFYYDELKTGMYYMLLEDVDSANVSHLPIYDHDYFSCNYPNCTIGLSADSYEEFSISRNVNHLCFALGDDVCMICDSLIITDLTYDFLACVWNKEFLGVLEETTFAIRGVENVFDHFNFAFARYDNKDFVLTGCPGKRIMHHLCWIKGGNLPIDCCDDLEIGSRPHDHTEWPFFKRLRVPVTKTVIGFHLYDGWMLCVDRKLLYYPGQGDTLYHLFATERVDTLREGRILAVAEYFSGYCCLCSYKKSDFVVREFDIFRDLKEEVCLSFHVILRQTDRCILCDTEMEDSYASEFSFSIFDMAFNRVIRNRCRFL
jgi:hypothetical protein